MTRRALWVSAVIVPSLLGSAPALARQGPSGFGFSRPTMVFSTHAPRAHAPARLERSMIAAHTAREQARLRLDRHHLAQTGGPIVLWPDWFPTTQVAPPPAEVQVPPQPEVIVLAGLHGSSPENVTPEPPADYSYVAGCHAIPNGYHCDIPHDETAR